MFAIIWSAKAAHEYLGTLEFWVQHNKSATYSTKLMNAVDKTVTRLSQNPKIGSPTIFEGIYKIQVLRNFSLIYSFKESTIHIISFWDNRRNPDDLKL